jgi:hypothetical protein
MTGRSKNKTRSAPDTPEHHQEVDLHETVRNVEYIL